jgi:hypothetical protein
MSTIPKPPEILDKIVDLVLSYKPTKKEKKGRIEKTLETKLKVQNKKEKISGKHKTRKSDARSR